MNQKTRAEGKFILKIAAYFTALQLIFLVILWLVSPRADQYIIKTVDQHNKEHNMSKKSLRQLISTKTGIPVDEVHIEWAKMYNDLSATMDSIEVFRVSVLPYLTNEMNTIRPRLEIRGGVEWWVAKNDTSYRVERSVEGFGSYFANQKWNYIFK